MPAKQQSLPSLTENQHQKLLLLSLLPLAHSHTTLSYTALLSALDLPTTHALEQLITTAIYAGLLTGTLDPAHSHVNVTSVAPLRDLAPGSLPTLQSALANWEARCDDAVRDLEKKAQAVRQGAVEREKEKRKRERALEVMLGKDGATGSGATGSSKKAPGQTEEEDTLMDLDDAGPPGGGSTWGGQTRSSRKMGGFQGLGRKLG